MKHLAIISATTSRTDTLILKNWNVIQSDVRTVCYDGYSGNIQLVAGGPPCQPFSLGGKHKAYDDKRDMFPEAVRAIREIQPEAFNFRECTRPGKKIIPVVLQLHFAATAAPRDHKAD